MIDTLSIKDQKNDLVKRAILNTAEGYFVSGGIEAVNLRTIARDIGFTPTNIYKYFKDKDAIIQALIQKRMSEIAQSVLSIKTDQSSIQNTIAQAFKIHIHKVLEYREHYRTVMLSKEKIFIEATAMLDPTSLHRLPAQQLLIDTIKRGIETNELRDVDPIKTAQVLWTGMFGLLIRVIVEDFKDMDYVDALVDTYIDLLFQGIK